MNAIKMFFGALFMLGLGGFMLWSYTGAIISDIGVERETLRPAMEYRVTEAECRVSAFVFSSCDVEVENILTGEEAEFGYMLWGNKGGDSVYAMKAPDGYLTTNVGVESVFNRVLALGFMAGVLLFLGFGVLLVMFRSLAGAAPRRARREAPATNPRREARRRAASAAERG